jgi:hypothetical protein
VRMRMPKLGEWVYGSAVAWGCTAPIFGPNDLLRGSVGCCFGTILVACEGGGACDGHSACQCNYDKPPWEEGGDCVGLPGTLGFCPTGCLNVESRCDQGPMSSCYYPPEEEGGSGGGGSGGGGSGPG